MSSLSTLPKGDSAWLLRKSIQRIMQQVSVLETNIGSSTTGNSSNTQVIFNDNGTLRGDAGLTYNAATDTLTAGSATITGDLTVDTSTLKVVAASDVVGINTTSPLTGNDAGLTIGAIGTVKALNIGLQNTFARLREKDAIDAFAITTNITGSNNQDDATKSSWKVRFGFGNGNDNFLIGRSNVGSTTFQDIYSVSATSAVWSDGAGGTRMTLNSTGLGVGVSPTNKLNLATSSGSCIAGMTNGTNSCQYAIDSTGPYIYSITGGAQSLRVLAPTGSTVFTIDGTGNVGIGVTPSAWLAAVKALDIGSNALAAYSGGITHNAYYDNTDSRWEYKGTGAASFYSVQGGTHAWYVAASGTANNPITTFASAAMTLDASGNLSVGATSVLNGVRIFAERSGGSVAGFNRTTSDGTNVLFYREGLIVGDVSVTTTGTTFNSTSDYRLKEAIQPLVGGLARVSALKPSIYKWKSNGSNGEGFLAHELAEVVPAAVTGEKDAVNEDGSIKAQSIDMSRVVPILVAAIQELTARVQTLEAK